MRTAARVLSLLTFQALPAALWAASAVEGSVTNAITGAPVPHAFVALGNDYHAQAGADGNFRLEGVRTGVYSPVVSKPGFFQGSNGYGALINVGVDAEVKNVALKIMPFAVASGHVFDADGEPLQGVAVSALAYQYQFGRRELGQLRTGVTNDLGEFEIRDLPSGPCYFVAVPHSKPALNGIRRVGPDEDYATTFFPSGTDVSQAAVTHIRAGADVSGIDFHLKPGPVYQVSGKVLLSEVPKGGNARVLLQQPKFPSPQGFASQSTVDKDGNFLMGRVVPGDYRLVYAGGAPSAEQAVMVSDHNIEGLTLRAGARHSIQGSSRVDSANSDGQQPPPMVQIFLDGWRGGPGAARPFPAGEAFEFRDLPPSVYRMNVSLAGHLYVKSVAVEGQDSADGSIDLTNSPRVNVSLVFGGDGGSVQGTVLSPDGRLERALVSLVPRVEGAYRPDLLKLKVSNEDGSFQMTDVAPGDYDLLAWEGVDSWFSGAPVFRRMFAGKAAKITVRPNGSETAQLVAVTAAEAELAKEKLP